MDQTKMILLILMIICISSSISSSILSSLHIYSSNQSLQTFAPSKK